MKKPSITTLALAAISLLAACSSDDSTTSGLKNQEQAIAFSNYLGRNVTRGTIVDNDNIKTQGVGVFAMYTEGEKYSSSDGFTDNFMSNVTVSYNKSSARSNSATSPDYWTYNPVRFWPNSPTDYVSFLAYGPQSASTTLCTANGGTTTGDRTYIKHEVNPTPSSQIDLLRNKVNTNNMQLYYDGNGNIVKTGDGRNISNSKPDGNGYDCFATVSGKEVVNLDMIHACARVAFVVTAPALRNPSNFNSSTTSTTGTYDSNATITVTKVALLGDNTTGTQDASSMTGAFYKEAYLNLTGAVTGSAGTNYKIADALDFWANKSTGKEAFSFGTFAQGTYTGTLRNTTQGKKLWIPKTTKETILKGTKKVTYDGTVTHTSYTVNSLGTQSSDYLFLIPQDFSEDNAEGNTLYCYIEYTVNYADAPTGKVKTAGVKYKAYGKIEKNFLAGGAYVIVISIGDGASSSLNPINFTVNVENWADEEKVEAKL